LLCKGRNINKNIIFYEDFCGLLFIYYYYIATGAGQLGGGVLGGELINTQ
jgi:hypothetical protein